MDVNKVSVEEGEVGEKVLSNKSLQEVRFVMVRRGKALLISQLMFHIFIYLYI